MPLPDRQLFELHDTAIAWPNAYKATGIEHWIQPGMRHTFCSNWPALHKDVNELVLQSGHDSVDTMWRHYHKGVSEADAKKFWAIAPPKRARKPKNVIQMVA